MASESKVNETKKRQNDDNILASCEVRCRGETHKVSIHCNGQLVFHNHPRDSIKRDLQRAKRGRCSYRCTKVAMMYIANQFSKRIPKEFIRARPVGDKNKILAWRIWRRKAVKRGPDKCLLDIGSGRYHDETGDDPAKALIRQLKVILHERGYRTTSNPERINIIGSYHYELTAILDGQNIKVRTNRSPWQEFIIKAEESPQWPLRFLADVCERQYFEALIASFTNRLQRTYVDFGNAIAERKVSFNDIWIKDKPFWVVSFRIANDLSREYDVPPSIANGIIKAVMQQIAGELVNTKTKINRLLAASKKRLQQRRFLS